MVVLRKIKFPTFNILFILAATIFINSCMFSHGTIEVVRKTNVETLNINVANIEVINHQVIITGSGLNKVTAFKIKNAGATYDLTIESITNTSIVANTLSNVSFSVGSVSDFIFSNAYASAIFQVNFINTNNSITASMLSSMGATTGQVMKYNGTQWIPTTIPNTQNYLGAWDAFANNPDLTIPSTTVGDFYIVSKSGTFNATSFAIGDWIISDGASWQIIPHSSEVVASFQGRRGIVTLLPADYVSLLNGSSKLPGSSINDFLDVNIVTPVNGSVLKYNSVAGKWMVGVDEIGDPAFSGTPNKAVVTDGSGALTASATTATELGYLSGVTSSIQTQLNSKLSTSLTNGNIYVGNGSGVASAVAVSGDATLSNLGVLSLKNVGTPGTYTSVTTDAQGRVTAGSNPAAGITALTGDVTASGTGSVAATIAASAVTSAKISDGSILPADLDFTGTNNIGTSGLVIRNLTGGFSPLVCSTAGYVPTWTVAGFSCVLGGTGTVSGTTGKIAKFTAGTVVGDSIMSESGTTVTLSGVLALPTTTATTGYVTLNGETFLHSFGGTYLGKSAGNLTNTGDNTAVGQLALYNIINGTSNTVFGSSAGFNTTSGSENTYIGSSAGYSNVAGTRNTYIGASAGSARSTGSSNVYIGASAGTLWTGNENTLVGDAAGASGSGFGGSQNTFMGYQVGQNSQGVANVFLGYKAGINMTTGSYNVIIGGNDGATIATSSNNIILSDGTGNERMRINSSGNVGIGTISPAYKLQVGNAGDGSEARANAWNALSDERLKKDFENIPEALEKILSINGYYYFWKNGTDHSKKMGVKAQEVKKVFPEVVSKGSDGFLSVSYNHLVAGVIEAIKEFYQKWYGEKSTIHDEIKLRTKLLAENKKEFATTLAQKEKEINDLKNENTAIKNYLCQRDNKAVFCK